MTQRVALFMIGIFVVLASLVSLAGCNPASPSPEPQTPKLQTVEFSNEFVTVTRTFLSPVQAGQEITVQVKITAKVDLRAVLLSETIPDGWQIAEGTSRAARLGLKAGESLEHSYTVRVGNKTGTVTLTGLVTVATNQGAQEPLEIASQIRVR
ncbi:MAG: NEW3 domain-containing protein [Candidatus Bipolaricaulota bacterium]|nr:NEW3 domain-containing protein [Candidatus Bipolaricaulota bacterium]MDW8140669.1 NEW3 domain-containing protein [Candidatus Bipolaricaulota bacterium]